MNSTVFREPAARCRLALFACAIALDTLAQTPPARPPSLHALPLNAAPLLDGDVRGDAAWRGAQPASAFWQVRPDEGQPATQKTEVFVGYTATSLYIGVICYDDQPASIVSSENRRDASLNDSDSFQVLIDTFQDKQNGFIFGTSPTGIQFDAQVIGENNFNDDWDTNWEVRTRVAEFGWSAEMEIPFKSLRYGAGEIQNWGINFQRNFNRGNEVSYWSPLPRQFNLRRVSLAGTLTGVRVPPQRNLKITPYGLVKAERGGLLPLGTHTDADAGVDVKYSITPSLTLDATYNTDFAQVEADTLQVNLDRFSLFFPEKRPFFLENAGNFRVGTPSEVELFFSRRIGVGPGGRPIPVVGGLRLSGKIGDNTNVGLLRMHTDALPGIAPENAFTVARINQELPNRSALGVFVADRNGDGSLRLNNADDRNRTYAFDGRLGVGTHTLISGFIAETHTPNVVGRTHAGSLRINYDSENWSNFAAYTEVGNEFRPEVGFLARRNYQKGEVRFFRRYRPDDLWGLHELRPHVAYRSFWGFDGYQETAHLHVDNHWEFDSGLEFHTGINATHEGVRQAFEIVDGVVVPAGEYDHREAQLVFQTNPRAPLNFSVTSFIGGFFGGERVTLEPELEYRLGNSISAELSYEYNDIDLPGGGFKANLARLRFTYSFTPKISLQALVQYDELDDLLATNLRFSWLHSANSGFFLVYNEVADHGFIGTEEPRRELILKYSHIFDVL